MILDWRARFGLRGSGDVKSRRAETATVEDIRACFRLLLGREPNSEEWPGHRTRAGQDLTAVVKSFLQSHEFSRRRLLEPTQFGQPVLAEVNGVKVPVHPDDIDVGAAVISNSYEPHVTALFEREVNPGMRVLDVGANCGYYTFLAARLVGATGRVFSIEPNATNVRLLEFGRRMNGFDNITIIPMAAGSTVGIATLHAAHTNGMTGESSDVDDILSATLVCRMPLDRLIEKIDFIKIDVEGQEFNALQGFVVGLEARPKIVSEFAPSMLRNATGESYLDLLLTRGYRIGVIAPDGSVPCFHREPLPIMKAFEAAGTHIDIFAVASE